MGRDAGGQKRHRAVPGDHSPVSVNDHRGVRLVAAQNPFDGLPHGTHLGLREIALGIRGRVSGGEQEPVPLAQRYSEGFGELQHHLGAGSRATRLDEAQVTRGDARLERELELAHAPAPAPVAQQASDLGAFGDRCHGRQARTAEAVARLPAR